MLQDAAIWQLECETGDDIVLRRTDAGAQVNEYIQVKTTDADNKWSIKELTARKDGRKGSSVCEKSLLCDKHGSTAWFRLVTTRAVSKKLLPFTRARGKREGDLPLGALIASFSTKYKDVKSASGHGLDYWARCLLWEVEGDEQALVSRNTNTLLRLASAWGLNPDFNLIKDTYDRLARLVGSMADAPASEGDEKIWTRTECLDWWETQIEEMRAAAASTVKVYQISSPKFFSELSRIDEQSVRRALYAYDVEYDGDVWRKNELIDHLLDWLPEVALPPRVLANYNHLSARRLPSAALKEIERRGTIDIPQIIAALVLHAILRHHFDAEPIACRIFLSIGGTMRSTSAHIVPLACGEEIWLGRSRLVTAATHHAVIDEVLTELRTALRRDVLLEEREIIIQLREPRHLRAGNLDSILSSTGKTSDLLKVVRLPILVAYDSETLQAGFDAGYAQLLRQEVEQEYHRIKQRIGEELNNVEVSIFLVPVECAVTLSTDFENRLRGRG